MLTKEDKGWIKENFATKADFNVVKDDIKLLTTKKEFTGVMVDIAILRNDLTEVKESYSRVETKVDKILNKLDKFTGNIADLDQENKMGSITLRRHDIQIHELATATGTTIAE